MPLYEYDCTSCHQTLETIQKVNDPPLVICPACGHPHLHRKTSLNSFRLKGSGWYRDGYNGKTAHNGSGKGSTVPVPSSHSNLDSSSPAA
ncbi:zinc ribbon domain-containing protein [bacterium]|nr:zinc ribbon domain-containing protein [bacterium]